eukprot:7796230-Alexandrium_andersonii.AAC.1
MPVANQRPTLHTCPAHRGEDTAKSTLPEHDSGGARCAPWKTSRAFRLSSIPAGESSWSLRSVRRALIRSGGS